MLRLKLLGEMQASWQGQPLPLKGRQWALLALLALGGGLSRRELGGLLWEKHSAHSLRQALYRLRQLPGASSWLLDGEHPRLQAEVDAHNPTLKQLRMPLLPGLPDDFPAAFADWLEQQRRHLEELRRERLWQAVQDEPEWALAHLYELIELDPLHESAVREAMRLEAQQGRLGAAQQLFEDLRGVLRRELGVEPLAATRALAESLRGPALSPLARRLWEARSLYPACEEARFWAEVLQAEAYQVAQAQAELALASLEMPVLSRPLQQFLHGQIAQALERLQPEQSGLAGRHWLQAHRPDKALPCFLRAGAQALRESCFEQAQQAFFLALWTAPAGPARREALLGLAQWAEQKSDLPLLQDICQALGSLARQLQDDLCYYEYHHRQAGLWLRRGRPQDAALEAQEALAVAQRLRDAERTYLAKLTLGAAYLVAGMLDKAEPWLEAAARAGSAQTRLRAYSNLGALHGLRGAHTASQAAFEEALTLARQEGQRGLASSLLQNLAATCLRLGRYTQAVERFAEALELARSLGDPRTEATCYRNLGYLYFLQGHFGLAWNTLEEALELAARLGPGLQVQVLLVQVELLGYLGQPAQAEPRLQQALALAAQDERLGWAARYNQALLALLAAPERPEPVLELLPGLHERLGDLAVGAEFDLLAFCQHPATLAPLLARCHPQTPVQQLAWQMGALRLGLAQGQPDPRPLAQALQTGSFCLGVRAYGLLAWAHHQQGQTALAQVAQQQARQLWEEQTQGLPRHLRGNTFDAAVMPPWLGLGA